MKNQKSEVRDQTAVRFVAALLLLCAGFFLAIDWGQAPERSAGALAVQASDSGPVYCFRAERGQTIKLFPEQQRFEAVFSATFGVTTFAGPAKIERQGDSITIDDPQVGMKGSGRFDLSGQIVASLECPGPKTELIFRQVRCE